MWITNETRPPKRGTVGTSETEKSYHLGYHQIHTHEHIGVLKRNEFKHKHCKHQVSCNIKFNTEEEYGKKFKNNFWTLCVKIFIILHYMFLDDYIFVFHIDDMSLTRTPFALLERLQVGI